MYDAFDKIGLIYYHAKGLPAVRKVSAIAGIAGITRTRQKIRQREPGNDA
jgi:hypothetical protein